MLHKKFLDRVISVMDTNNIQNKHLYNDLLFLSANRYNLHFLHFGHTDNRMGHNNNDTGTFRYRQHYEKLFVFRYLVWTR